MLYYYCLDYIGKLLVHAVCLAVLFFCHFIVMSLFLLNKINGVGVRRLSKSSRMFISLGLP